MQCSCGRTDGVMGYGSTASGVMFIGIAPGPDEWRRSKRPFTGQSGRLLNALLDAVGLDRQDVYCTNLICWYKDAPDKDEIAACAARLSQEIQGVNPRVIVPLGKIAVEHLLGLPFGKARGAIIKKDGYTWLPTNHPAACLHRAVTPQEKEAQIDAAYSLARDLSKLQGADDALYNAWFPPRHVVVTELEQAQWFLDNLPDKPIALDIETNYDKDWEDAHPFDSDIVCVGIGWDSRKATVLALQPDEWAKLQWPDAHYVYHNGSFDTQEIMRHTGVWLPIGDDTMLMSYSVDERNTRGLHKLKSLAREFCVDAKTRVLKGDLTWQPIGSIQVGDELVGVEEYPSSYRRTMLPSVVQSKRTITVETRYQVIVWTGSKLQSLVCSPEHMFLAVSPKGRGRTNTQKFNWVQAKTLGPDDRIATALDPWGIDESKEAYYLQGIFDGEGWIHSGDRSSEVGFGQLDGPVADYTISLLHDKGYTTSRSEQYIGAKGSFGVYRLTGNRAALRFLGQIRPRRLLANPKCKTLWAGRAVWGNNTEAYTVLQVNKLPAGEVVAIQTSSKTFIAEGAISHNCGADFYEEDDHRLLTEEQLTGASPEQMEIQDQKLKRLYEYNAKDVVYTWRLHSYLKNWQEQEGEGTARLYKGLLLPGSHMLREAQYRGINADFPRMQQVSLQFYTEYAALQKKMNTWARDTLGDPAFNPRSPKQVKKLLELQGYPVPDTRKATLEQLVEDNPDIDFVPDLRRYRTLDKMCTNYLVDVSKQIKYDGRVHPHAFLIGTVNGRLTYTKPAMQTLPKPKTVRDLGVIRSIFTATTDEYILLEADYAQIEGWVGAYLSEDQVLWDELSSGDWHTATTVNMFGKQQHEVTPWEWASLRDAGKHINYGIFFDESAQGLTRRPPIGIGQPIQVCQAYLNKWKQLHPKFMAYQAEQKRLAREQGFIATPFGRKRRFPFIVNDHQLRQAVNSKIQSTAGDYTLSSAIRLWPQLKRLDTHLLFIEHDALYYEVSRAHFDEAVALIRYEMERPPLPGLPSIKTEIDIGPNLAELEKYNG